MLEQGSRLSRGDQDDLAIYNGCFYSRAIEENPAYRRGMLVSERVNGPVIPSHEDPVAKRSTTASLLFEECFGREPKDGDVLCPEILNSLFSPMFEEWKFRNFADSWARQNPDEPCPMKFENGKRYALNYGAWNCVSREADKEWRFFEWELTSGINWVWSPKVPKQVGIYFLGVIDGEHKFRGATSEEVENYVFPTTGLIGRLAAMLSAKT
jgi:hypothetical protein